MILGGSSHERWEQLAHVTLGIALLFAALTVYGVVNGENLQGLAMTIAPGLLSLGLWRLVVWRRDR